MHGSHQSSHVGSGGGRPGLRSDAGRARQWNLVGCVVINESFTYARLGQNPRSLSVHIEDPRRTSEGAWECRVEIPGHWEAIQISGASPIQATSLAFRFVRECLERLNADGRVSYSSGAIVDLDELFGLAGISTQALRL